jgi:UDP-glucose 4-epimerase
LGSHLAGHLLGQGHDVTVMDDLSGGFVSNLPKGAKFVQADICDRAAVSKEMKGKDLVYHLAAHAAEGSAS